MVYTIGPMEKSAVAEIRRTIVPAAHEVAVVCSLGMPIQPVILIRPLLSLGNEIYLRMVRDIHEQDKNYTHPAKHQRLPAD
jgi:hypothetical protein